MRTLIAVMLEAAGYRVLEAADRPEAINVWKRESASIDLLLVDVWLPGSTGPDIVGFFRKDHPEVAALFISGMNPAVQPEIKKLIRE